MLERGLTDSPACEYPDVTENSRPASQVLLPCLPLR